MYIQQFVLNEIDINRSMKHENILELVETYESSKYIILVLPLCTGGELHRKIHSKGMYRESDARPVMRKFFSALAYMHSKNIVHRDLKPENLMLASKANNWDLRITDFGLSTVITPGRREYLKCGSPGYVAPEILQDKGCDCLADMFSAGVILYGILTG